MPMELDMSRLVIEGTTEHDVRNQRELQYWVKVTSSPVEQHAISKFNFSTSGSRIQLVRLVTLKIK